MSAVVSTHAVESGVINSPVQKTWGLLSRLDFSWWRLVEGCTLVTGSSPRELDSTVKLQFKDGVSWVIAIRELSSIHHSLTFEVIECQPASPVSSAIHTISLKKVTNTDATFIEWVSDFSSDATAQVILDSTFKRHEAFNDIAQALA